MRLLTLALLTTTCLLAQPSSAAPDLVSPDSAQRPAWDGRLQSPERVTDHVWVMHQPSRLWAVVIGNVEIIEQTDGVVLVDSGGSIADGRDVVRAVAKLTPKPIKAIAITHWHNDHPLGIPGILETYPNARIISTPATRDYMRTELKTGIGKADPGLDKARRERAADTLADFKRETARTDLPADMRAQYDLEARWIPIRLDRQMGNYVVFPTETVKDRLLIDDPVAPVELRYYGVANTHGDLTAWVPKQKVLITGDIVVSPTPYGFEISTNPWLRTIAQMERLPFRILIPGHGSVQRNRSYLATLKWSMNDIASRARAAAKAGVSKEKAFATFDQREEQARFHATDAWTKKWLNDYWIEGMFDTAFNEAKGIEAPGK